MEPTAGTPRPTTLLTGRRAVVALGSAAVLVLGLLLVRGMAFRAAAGWGAGAPDPVRDLLAAVAEFGLLGLVALYGIAVLVARARGRRQVTTAVLAGGGAVAAYGSSELVKVLVAELRPCHTFALSTVATCPAAGDWAWPSNHATLAGAFAVAVLLLVPRLGLVAVPCALAVAASRVLVGVHYPHDVVAGLVLGAAVVTLVVGLAGPAAGHLLLRTSRR